MRPSFYPRLVNGPFDDPGLFVPFLFERRAVIFDLGDIESLANKNILKISHAFITHTHMDHFVGFDRLLRLFLGREKKLYIYGPEGFLNNIEGKLAGYSWNLVGQYDNRFTLNAAEVHSEYLLIQQYKCRKRFRPTDEVKKQPFHGLLIEEPAFSVYAAILDHNIPCLGFTIQERFHVNIIKENVFDLGLEIGPWIKRFKQALYNKADPDSEFEAVSGKKSSSSARFVLRDLTSRIARITPGQKVTYIADVAYSESNVTRLVDFAKNADHLFMEAAFLEQDRDIAGNKYHLTARQAGSIAEQARVKQLTLFHFSPRYTGQANLFKKEARQAYRKGKILS